MINEFNVMGKRKYKAFLIEIILLLTLCNTPIYAQSEAGVLSLLISPSTQANAMGQTYGNIVATSPMATIFNPASLGLFSQKHYFGRSYYPEKIPWLRTLASGINYDASITSFGINLNNYIQMPLSFGIGLHKVRFDFGEQNITSESGEVISTFTSYDEVKGTTLSIALDYYIRASFGYTRKSIDSNLAIFDNEQGLIGTKINAHDIGFIFQFPVYELLKKFRVIPDHKFNLFTPYFDTGFYYSKTNIGGKISYIDAAQADPLPRNLSIGINFNAGFIYKSAFNSFNLISFKWAREVDDILVNRFPDGQSEYVSGLHDIKFWDNLILGKSNSKIITKKGHVFNFGDFYFIRKGSYEDLAGRVVFKTEGWSINYIQPIRIFATYLNLEDNRIMTILSNIHLEKHYSKYKADLAHPLHGTEYRSYVIRINSFSLN